MLERSNGELGTNVGGVLDPPVMQGWLVDYSYNNSKRFDTICYGL
jgi:hypothetical protein